MSLTVTIPVSVGELCDKISILDLKVKSLAASGRVDALANVQTEHDLLIAELQTTVEGRLAGADVVRLSQLRDSLLLTNSALWGIEDNIRACEAKQDFGPEFIHLARAVYQANDRRYRIKREIDTLTGSAVKEEKQYTAY